MWFPTRPPRPIGRKKTNDQTPKPADDASLKLKVLFGDKYESLDWPFTSFTGYCSSIGCESKYCTGGYETDQNFVSVTLDAPKWGSQRELSYHVRVPREIAMRILVLGLP
jgi:hypothetical protein